MLGPLLRNDGSASLEVVRKLVNREVPASPRLAFAVVDVRDVATAHRLAMETPAAAGNRYLCAGDQVWMEDIATLLAAEFGPRGYRIPTRRLPYALMWAIARFDPAVRLALEYVGREQIVSAAQARDHLGWTQRPLRATVTDTAESLIEHGLAPAPRSRSAQPAPAVR